MEHIKTPIRPGLSGEKTCAIYGADDKMIAFNPFRSVGPVLNEIVLAVNMYAVMYDALVTISATEDACQKPGCSLDTPRCAAMFARSALALVREGGTSE